MPSDDWATSWETSELSRQSTLKRSAAAQAKSSTRRKFAKLAKQNDVACTDRAVQLAAATAKPDLSLQTAASRLNLLKQRVLNKAASELGSASVPSTTCTVTGRW